MHGPAHAFGKPGNVTIGGKKQAVKGVAGIAQEGYEWICAEWCRTGQKKEIDLVGHSRGAVIAVVITQWLNDNGCCCDGKNYIKPVKVRFLGLYDPVDNDMADIAKSTTIPAATKVAWVRAVPFQKGGHASYTGGTFGKFNRPNYSSGTVTAKDLAGTHSALGGAPTYTTEMDRGWKLEGYNDKQDLLAGIAADTYVRDVAIAAGVPIKPVADYDFGELESWKLGQGAKWSEGGATGMPIGGGDY